MNQGREPAVWKPVRAGVQALAIFAVAALGMGGAAMAAPNGDPGPPEHAQGNGPPAQPVQQQAPPAAPQSRGKARGHAKKESASGGGQVQSGGDSHGKSGGGHDKARGKGHSKSGGGSGGQSGNGGGNGSAGGNGGDGGSNRGKAGKVTLCHATGSDTNPYVMITVSANAVPAHQRHQGGEDIIPAPSGGCPGGSSQAQDNENGHEKVTICHATGSETNPYVVITISENALSAHLSHQDGEDIYPVPSGGCPSTEVVSGLGNPPSGIVSPLGGDGLPVGELAGGTDPAGEVGGVLGVADEGENGAAPGGDDDGEVGGVLGVNQGGGENDVAGETTGSSLPYTGLGLGLLAAIGLLLAVAGTHLRRKAS